MYLCIYCKSHMYALVSYLIIYFHPVVLPVPYPQARPGRATAHIIQEGKVFRVSRRELFAFSITFSDYLERSASSKASDGGDADSYSISRCPIAVYVCMYVCMYVY